ncbi:carboxymuconolactone decarboxylase family protein [Kitasatospora cinereorecta]|uniref:Carboxymuconolactone decarboxylase family protein n=1 Tax=Kitasatospora cinereorecta TaxID=285560 RepID=A0ABW0VJJ2_9ACTN
MPHIQLEDSQRPGIGGLLAFRPGPARPLLDLAEVLLRKASPLTPGERELIVALVSSRNDCQWSKRAHGAFAAAQLPGGRDLVDAVCHDPESAPVPEKLKSLLQLAAAVTEGGKAVKPEHVDRARAAGADDVEIHDTVLVAAAFCMFNRYVSGLATSVPDDPAVYESLAETLLSSDYRTLGGYPRQAADPSSGAS